MKDKSKPKSKPVVAIVISTGKKTPMGKDKKMPMPMGKGKKC
ncbi:MAG: hypothetical protein WC465_04890 [Patescibacteria group bacterium]